MRRRRILLPVDFSTGTRAVIKRLDLVSAARPLAMHLVHIIEPRHFAAPPAPVWVDDLAARERDARRALERLAQLVRRRLGAAATVMTHVITAGSAHDAICKLADRLAVDLIVVPTHGRTGLPHVLLGSVTERVLRHSGRPVLAIPVTARRKRR